jgi:hypothetical protein
MIESAVVSAAMGWLYQRVLEGNATADQNAAIRERLRREATYNLEILRLLENAGVKGPDRVRALDLQAMAELVALPVPPESVLRQSLGPKSCCYPESVFQTRARTKQESPVLGRRYHDRV